MMQDTLLGLDIGTNATKAILFDLSGAEIATAEQGYPLSTPQPGWAEQDPEQVWQALVGVLQTIVKKAGADHRIRALALAAQSGSLIPTDAGGRPVYPMITWLDSRTEALVERWRAEKVEKPVRELSGWWLQPGLPLPGIGWLRENMPDTFARVERFLGVLDFLNRRLTGRFCADLSSATEMQLVDIASGDWSPQLCRIAGVKRRQLSDLQPAGTVVGPITPQVSRLTGLPANTPVINGGHDQCCAALAMGMLSPGKVMLATGTAWVITGVVQTPVIEAIPTPMNLNFHVVPRCWTISQLLGGFGASVEWFINQCWQNVDPGSQVSRASLYASFNELVKQTAPGSRGLLFLPLGGSRPGGFAGLRLDHTRAELGRAVLEGAAFEVRRALETMRRSGLPIEQLWISGGATHSPIWPQILADATGVPISLAQYAQWPALGAAILAGWGAEVFDSLETGVERLQKPVHQIMPDEKSVHLYDERFAAYQQAARLS